MRSMDIVVLFFIVLFAVAAVIVAMVVINMCKRLRKAEQDRKQRAEKKEQQLFEEKQRKTEAELKRLEDEAQQKLKDEEQKRLADELTKVEEKRKRIAEEKRRRAQEEEQCRKAEQEARESAEKGKPERRKTEEERPESEEERNQVKEESQQKKEEARSGERRSPIKRGGRSRGSIKRREMEQGPGTKPRSLKLEIVCWNEGWRWIVGIEVPEDLETLSVAQNEELLDQDTIDESLYRLRDAEGGVKVTWTGGQKDIPLVEAGRNYLIFKMRKDWKGLGRLVRHPTTGYYLTIVPQEWKRDEEVSGSASVNPESVQVDGYKAHFFCQEQDGNMAIGFVNADGQRIQVEPGSSRFQLVGREIGDASEDMGPLFGGQPPFIRTLNEKRWSDVGVIVAGEEGSGRNRWRTPFVPQVGAEEQRMPDELTNRRGGWYFVRFYDKDDNLLESMDFRFLMALKDIRMDSSDCLPGPNGHDNVTVQFLHQTGCKVELMDEDVQSALEIRRESGQTIVTVPSKPDCDQTHWILRESDAEIGVTVLVGRVWWAFGVMRVAPTNWMDKPITSSRKDFTAISDKTLFVRFARPRFVKEIDVGFDRGKSRSYQVEVEKNEIAIPLRDFCDAEEIENRQEEFRINIWVQPRGAKTAETVVVKVPAELPPLVEPKQRQDLLQAIVKCRRGERKGKGFSRNEITEAGIIAKDVKCFRIPYDKRRKASHFWNVENLKHLTRGDKQANIGG